MDNLFKFYLEVIVKEADEMGISQDSIKEQVQELIKKHSVSGLQTPDSVDYNIGENKYAYIYLYATCHSHMMIQSLCKFKESNERAFNEWINKLTQEFKICAIGGGPGIDIIAILYFLKKYDVLPSGMNISCVVPDKYTEWQLPFYNSFDALRKYELVSDYTTPQFIDNDLFDTFSDSLKETIKSSDLITMNKFVSSVVANRKCKDLLKKIVEMMKPGAFLFFLDNSGGYACKTMEATAKECHMEVVYGPNRFTYEIDKNMEQSMYDDLYISEFGANSKRHAKIVVAVWQKIGRPVC